MVSMVMEKINHSRKKCWILYWDAVLFPGCHALLSILSPDTMFQAALLPTFILNQWLEEIILCM